jgi:hypothetical protein
MSVTALARAPHAWTEGLETAFIESGNRIDRLMTLEIRPLKGGLPPGIVVPMYEVCRAHHGGPLSMAAAVALKSAVKPGSTVFIATGAGVAPKLPFGETDGPVGAAALATALVKGLDARVVLVTEDAHLPPVEAAAHLINAKLRTWAEEASTRCEPVRVETFPIGMNAGQARARELMERHDPAAIVFVERDGPNVEGQFHGVRGDCRDPSTVGYVYLLAYHAAERGVLTIGIGDGGNEVGFGAVRQAIRDVLPEQGRSLAGHPSGVVTVVETDITVSASVSNWGACAVVAALGVVLGNEHVLHDPDTEHELIAATMSAGARDGATSKQSVAVDGIDIEGHRAFVALLKTVAEVSIRTGAAKPHLQ